MAVPKKRTGKSAQAKRRANWKAITGAMTKCSNCGEVIPTHTVCPVCGSYKGKVVSIKNENHKAEATLAEVKTKNEVKAAEEKETVEEAKEAVETSEVKEEN